MPKKAGISANLNGYYKKCIKFLQIKEKCLKNAEKKPKI